MLQLQDAQKDQGKKKAVVCKPFQEIPEELEDWIVQDIGKRIRQHD